MRFIINNQNTSLNNHHLYLNLTGSKRSLGDQIERDRKNLVLKITALIQKTNKCKAYIV